MPDLGQVLTNMSKAKRYGYCGNKGMYNALVARNWNEFYEIQTKINIRRFIADLAKNMCINRWCEFYKMEPKLVRVSDSLYELGFRGPREVKPVITKCLDLLGYTKVSVGINWKDTSNGFIPVVKFYDLKNGKNHYVGNSYSIVLEKLIPGSMFGDALVMFAGEEITPVMIEQLPD